MKFYLRRKWMMMAVLSMGTAMQITACREDAALFGLRVAFSSVTLPINQFIRVFFLGFI